MANEALHKLLQVTRTQEIVANFISTSMPQELTIFYHQVLCSTPMSTSTLLKAIRNKQFISIPGLTYDLIYKNLSNQPAIDKGQMICKRSVIQSIQSNKQEILHVRKQVCNMNPLREA